MYQGKYIVSGYVNGRKFRPSNWPERLCEVGASFDPRKRIMRYSPYLHIAIDEQHDYCVHVDFDQLSDELARYVTWFVDSNQLNMISLGSEENTLPSAEVIETNFGVPAVAMQAQPKAA